MPTKISSTSHPLVKHFTLLREDKNYRNQKGSCLVTGKKLIEELCLKRAPLQILTEASEAVFRKITGLPHPEPIVAEFPLPKISDLKTASSILVIDQLQDPGNVGTLLRTALALGWGGVYFLPNTVDPFNDKVLRSSKGALFTLPFQIGSFSDLVELAKDFKPLIADMDGTAIQQLPQIVKPLLVLSHEGAGVSPLMEKFGTLVSIPIKEMESLNVAIAGSILMYELCKMTT
jgi:TrmH family RNA methyltransferase